MLVLCLAWLARQDGGVRGPARAIDGRDGCGWQWVRGSRSWKARAGAITSSRASACTSTSTRAGAWYTAHAGRDSAVHRCLLMLMLLVRDIRSPYLLVRSYEGAPPVQRKSQ